MGAGGNFNQLGVTVRVFRKKFTFCGKEKNNICVNKTHKKLKRKHKARATTVQGEGEGKRRDGK